MQKKCFNQLLFFSDQLLDVIKEERRLKSNFTQKNNEKKEIKENTEKEKDEELDKDFTDLWSFRSKKNQKL